MKNTVYAFLIFLFSILSLNSCIKDAEDIPVAQMRIVDSINFKPTGISIQAEVDANFMISGLRIQYSRQKDWSDSKIVRMLYKKGYYVDIQGLEFETQYYYRYFIESPLLDFYDEKVREFTMIRISEIQLGQREISVSSESGSYTNNYTIINPEAGRKLKLSSSAGWVSNLTSTSDQIRFHVSENNSPDIRTATITVSYHGTDSQTFEIKQDGVLPPEIQLGQREIPVSFTSGSYKTSYTITNPVTGQKLSLSSTAEWVSNLSATSDQIYFDVSKNNSTDIRTATITVSYPGAESQTFEVKQAGTPPTIQFTVNGVTFKMIKVEKGTFTMGAQSSEPNGKNYDSEADSDESPVHEVTLTQDYYIGQFEVSQKLWEVLMGSNPSFHQGAQYPVENVSWNDIVNEFLPALNQLNLQPGMIFSLPTEAQWEYAARGGNKSRYYKYSGSNDVDEVAWYYSNCGYETQKMGTKKPNELGIYDMSGNVDEWCADWCEVYSSESQNDPMGPCSGSGRVARSGSYCNYMGYCRVSDRRSSNPDYGSSISGFRLVLSDTSQPPYIQLGQREISVLSASGSYTNSYTITNPIAGQELSLSSDADWISNLTAIENQIHFDVTQNNSTSIRTATIKVSYTGAEPQTFKIQQSVALVPADLIVNVGDIELRMMRVEAGSFMMGAQSSDPNGTNYDSEADSDESPVHEVTLTQDYYIGQTEVTHELWEAVMGSNPSSHTGNSQYPVEQVSWDDIVNEFLPKLNSLTGKTFSLPTEAQWEYAARGGNKSRYYKYSGSSTLDDVAWYLDGNSGAKIHMVGTKKPNELGIYDMSGNVDEWCADRYGNYSSEPQNDPKGPVTGSGSSRILRSGSFDGKARSCRVSDRGGNLPGFRYYSYGFRLVLSDIPQPSLPPEIQLGQREISVSSASGSYTNSYTITNPVAGQKLILSSSNIYWISNLSATSDQICFDVTQNNSTDIRIVTITVSYPGAETQTFEIKQSGNLPPEIQLDQKEISVSSESGSYTNGYTITNPVVGQELSLSSSADWVCNLTTTQNRISFDVSQNNSTSIRTATITVSYPGVQSQIFEIRQAEGYVSADLIVKVGGIELRMMKVEAGTFTMGATSEQGSDVQSDENPAHEVTLTHDYYIGQLEVTQKLWEAVMGSNPSSHTDNALNPVENVSWYMIVDEFLPKLNSLTGKTFSLPTEAQWEYAARGGNKSGHSKYSGSNQIDEVAWYGNSWDNTHKVGTKDSNELGIYDMSGNVWEWCADWYDSYSPESQSDPKGPGTGSGRVLRGGGYYSEARCCRVSFRHNFSPDYSYSFLGFRLVLSDTPQPPLPPEIQLGQREISVSSASGSYTNSYTILNQVAGKELSLSSTAAWVSNLTVTSDQVCFDVSQNNSTSIRTATITVSYPGAETQTFEIKQTGILPSTKDFTVNGVTFKMIKVEAGTFMMGATSEQGSESNDDEKPAHEVTLTQDYYIGEFEVTQELWEAVMGSNPSSHTGNSQYPVEQVSWDDIVNEFLPKLNSLTGKTFSLPTEAQWEYAARGGNKSRHYKYSGSNTIDDVAWYGNINDRTHKVGTKDSNELGIYDMSGNVCEWCTDWYDSYSSESQSDPKGPATGSIRVLRGGSFNFSASLCRVSIRSNSYHPAIRRDRTGFRLVLLP